MNHISIILFDTAIMDTHRIWKNCAQLKKRLSFNYLFPQTCIMINDKSLPAAAWQGVIVDFS